MLPKWLRSLFRSKAPAEESPEVKAAKEAVVKKLHKPLPPVDPNAHQEVLQALVGLTVESASVGYDATSRTLSYRLWLSNGAAVKLVATPEELDRIAFVFPPIDPAKVKANRYNWREVLPDAPVPANGNDTTPKEASA